MRALVFALAVLVATPAMAWHPWKTQEIPLERQAQKPPPPVVEVRPTRGTIKTHEGRELAKSVGRSAVIIAGSRILLGILGIGLNVVGIPIIF